MMFFERLINETAGAREKMLQAPIIGNCLAGNITLDQYTAFLSQAYHHVKHTVPLLMACGSRLPANYEWLREAIAEYIDEEKGHQQWILNDLRACGCDSDLTEFGHPGRDIELMTSYLYHQIDRQNPIGFFGMVWVLEGTSVGIGGQIAKQVRDILALPNSALTYLSSHSELDQDHIQFFAEIVNKIDSVEDQNAIIASANMVFHLYGNMLRSLPGEYNGR
ncbi:TenA family transcriptional regulator [Vibrio viridaestus]|uniref:Biliverdin-producing heme oxygenase n=1 Tax=Vibrio viridaestus TaxID=2487322 RepID=A0A3N9TKF9_9VIBR|nr:iron-containing redox enzyme family protein [Vibrio viridaestus]RQW64878.1 biliverdin-producing heme oxygenase [Vibrio viridaestus]